MWSLRALCAATSPSFVNEKDKSLKIRWAPGAFCITGHVPLASDDIGKVIPVLYHFPKVLGFTTNQMTLSEHKIFLKIYNASSTLIILKAQPP